MGISIDYYTNHQEKEMIEKYNQFINSYKNKIDCIIAKAFELEGLKLPNVYIGIGVVTENEIKQINNEYRNINKSTDVLSFPIFTKLELDNIKKTNKVEEISIGDIVLCMDVIQRQAKKYRTSFNKEMLFMLVHGICHLLGYDHEEEQDSIEMKKLEKMILKGCEV